MRKVAITGVTGFLGTAVARTLRARGWQVISMTRRPEPGSPAIRFELGHPGDSRALEGGEARVH